MLQFDEYGNKEKPTILMLHGAGQYRQLNRLN